MKEMKFNIRIKKCDRFKKFLITNLKFLLHWRRKNSRLEHKTVSLAANTFFYEKFWTIFKTLQVYPVHVRKLEKSGAV